jgi:hypothetical protein
VPVSILQITSVASLFGQQVLNRWHFVNLDGAVDVSLVLPSFTTEVIAPLMNDLSSDITMTELLYRIITDPLQPQRSYGVGYPIVGVQGQPSAASFVAVTVKWAPGPTVVLSGTGPVRRIRRGGKRIAGVPQPQLAGDVWNSTFLSAFAAPFDNYLGMSDGGFLPCIAGFPVQPPPPSDPDDPTLQIPDRYALIEGVSLKSQAGSQVSRKVGHGR